MQNNLTLRSMFGKVTACYDTLNRVITWGLDRRWRLKTAEECLKSSPGRILDLCTGTGDMAVTLAALSGGNTGITAADFSPEMLRVAAKKIKKKKAVLADLLLVNAAELAFPDATFDSVTVSFGFRNLTYRNRSAEKHIGEIRRVLKPGGKCYILESSQPPGIILRKLFHFYVKFLAKPVALLFSDYPPAYRYLADSIVNYYSIDELAGLMRNAGFSAVEARPFLAGVVALIICTK